jgi:nucleoside diphosphate kinase
VSCADLSQLIELEGFHILEKRNVHLTDAHVREFYAEHIGKEFYPKLLSFMTSAPAWALVLAKRDAIADWRAMMGPTDSGKARETAPGTIRALYGTGRGQGTCSRY